MYRAPIYEKQQLSDLDLTKSWALTPKWQHWLPDKPTAKTPDLSHGRKQSQSHTPLNMEDLSLPWWHNGGKGTKGKALAAGYRILYFFHLEDTQGKYNTHKNEATQCTLEAQEVGEGEEVFEVFQPASAYQKGRLACESFLFIPDSSRR